jgi:hypothetical protein
MIPPRSLVLFFGERVERVTACDLARVAGTIAAVAAGDGETQCLKVRSDEV